MKREQLPSGRSWPVIDAPKRYKVTGLNGRNQCEYRNTFASLDDAEMWYGKVKARQAVTFVILFDTETQQVVKKEGC